MVVRCLEVVRFLEGPLSEVPLYIHVAPCIDKSMQIIRDSIDKTLTFNVCLLQLIFQTSLFTYYIFI